MVDERTMGELSRQLDRIDNSKVDRDGFIEWKKNVDQWRNDHDDKHSWLIRSIGVIGLTVVIELLIRLAPLVGGQ